MITARPLDVPFHLFVKQKCHSEFSDVVRLIRKSVTLLIGDDLRIRKPAIALEPYLDKAFRSLGNVRGMSPYHLIADVRRSLEDGTERMRTTSVIRG